mmetsp:Transcript_26615/g.48155  ORF Transcript_26615/g.48155 Transcript_26615/m.48155 type:complete len:152 (+) Transcript_26615:1097-1552(+)
MILGDAAQQGHGHDNFGLSLCMLHLFTGHAPYEEILEDVFCPSPLKKKLRQIWVDDEYSGFNVLRTMILPDVDGEEQDETLYHTLYRYLVLFGIAEERAIPLMERLCGTQSWTEGIPAGSRGGTCFRSVCSRSYGNNEYIARAQKTIEMME